MPTYDYSCPACGSVFEAMRKFSERDEAIACPACGSPVQRKVSAPVFMAGGLSRSGPHWVPDPGARPITYGSKPEQAHGRRGSSQVR